MGWAGALEGIFQTFADDFAAVPSNLYQNFRSKPRLRRMQNAMVRVMDPPAAIDDDEICGDEGTIEILHYSSDAEEAEGLAQLIRDLIEDEGIPSSEIAVLVSRDQGFYCQKLVAAFTAADIPYREEDSSSACRRTMFTGIDWIN